MCSGKNLATALSRHGIESESLIPAKATGYEYIVLYNLLARNRLVKYTCIFRCKNRSGSKFGRK